MRVKTTQSNATWSVKLQVIDKDAKKRSKKSIVYDYRGKLALNSLAPSIFVALNEAETEIEKWKSK